MTTEADGADRDMRTVLETGGSAGSGEPGGRGGPDARAPEARPSRLRGSRWVGAALWLVAIATMLGAAVYQRATGPTYPLRGTTEIGGVELAYALIRSANTPQDAIVEIPDPGDAEAVLVYRRYPTDDPLARVPFRASRDVLQAPLPRQPAAGKLEYHVELETDAGVVRIPSSPEEDPIIRFKDPVPAAALVPHVLFMFFAILIGVRAGLAALVGRREARRYAWLALGLMSVGGMILGPVVQKHAFGAYWTGFPLGYDLTDNKTLIMWLVWLAACAVLGLSRRGAGERRGRERAGRVAVVLATAVMLVVYLVPHSLRGSELDYDRVDEGAHPAEAVRTG
ncbi:MAG: hypothetical protein ACLFRX_08600 [Gemmatimonadota bacterium]